MDIDTSEQNRAAKLRELQETANKVYDEVVVARLELKFTEERHERAMAKLREFVFYHFPDEQDADDDTN